MWPGLEQAYEGFAQTNLETLEMLHKALEAGTGVDAGSFVGGRALIPESLDTTLVNILHSQDEAKLFQRLKKQPIKSPVHQWTDRTEVGADDGAWVGEGDNSVEADQTLNRRYVAAKYLQTKREVTLQASISNMIEDAMALEENAGTLWLIRNIEKSLFRGNATAIAEEPDGLDVLIPSSNVIDIRGADATSAIFENAITEAARIVRGSYGKVSDMFMSLIVAQDIQQLLRDRIRFEAKVGTPGSAVFTEYPTPFGVPKLNDNIFITEGGAPAASTVTGRPGTDTALVLGSVTSPVDATALFGAGDAGDYVYQVEPINKYGAGTAIEVAATGLAAGDNYTIANTTYPIPAATAYRIYRGIKGSTTAGEVKYMFTVTHAQVVADSNAYLDRNFELPGTSSVYFNTLDPMYNAIEWAQFLPMMKFDLYPTGAAVYPFLMLLFGALILKKPVQHARINNVSPSDLGWF